MLNCVSTMFVGRVILTISKVKLRTFQIPVFSFRCLASYPKKFTVSYNHSSGDSVFLGSTIGQVVSQAADQSGDQLAFVFRHQNVRRTFSQVDKESDQLAASFLELGLKPGERIALWSTNCYEWILTQVAAAKAGLILVQVNTAYQPDELEYCLNKTSCKALVAAEGFKTQDYFQELNHLLPEITVSKPGQLQSKRCPDLHTVVMLTKRNYPGVYKFEDILQVAGNEKLREIKKLVSKIQFDDPVCIQLTSLTSVCEQLTLVCEQLTLVCEQLTSVCIQLTLVCVQLTSVCEQLTLVCEQLTSVCVQLTSLTSVCEQLTLVCEQLTSVCEQLTLVCEQLTLVCEQLTSVCIQLTLVCVQLTSVCEQLTLVCEQLTSVCVQLTSVCEQLTSVVPLLV
ncbi:medium-chain acyl-CoA ligase ACSF2, mitochondrial-like [Tachypleus tridentatus]|uniref:medium-chain acyl-CoA ligase ACSF2, mitochondrial-like n=1 Tax=Tachypleus tridentatus TaxID=6853 RepID=UPI003FD39002